MELISVIIPVFNVEKYLARCLDSVINQTYKNLEIILVDDGSPDKSGNICDEYTKIDTRIKVIHKENGGVSSARNVGISIATGEYIGFVDSDDWLEPDMYEKLMEYAKKDDSDITRIRYYKTYDDRKEYPNYPCDLCGKINLNDKREDILCYLFSGKLHAYPCLLLIKREFIKNGMNFDSAIAMREDLIWLTELVCLANSISIYDIPLYNYYQNINSATNFEGYKKRNLENMLVVVKRLEEILKKYNLYTEKLKNVVLEEFFWRILSDITYIAYECKDKKTALELLANDEIREFLLRANKKKLSLKNKIFYSLVKINCKELSYCFCILRGAIKKVIKGE